MDQDIRWKQRFANFQRAIQLLQEVRELELGQLTLLEKEGIIQRFKFTLELAWKTLKDKMEFDGLFLERISPRMVVKEAYKSKYIDDIETWLKMIDDRTRLSHIYDLEVLEQVIPDIQQKYTPLLSALCASFSVSAY